MARNNLITIKNAEASPIVYQGFGTEVPTPDVAILERGMANLETRINNAQLKRAETAKMLGEVEAQLHDDPGTAQWFNQYKENILNQIDQQYDAGNFGTTIRTAMKLGSEAAQDTELLNRIKDETRFQANQKEIETMYNKGEIGSEKKDYLERKSQKDFLTPYNEKGEYKEGAQKRQVVDYDSPAADVDFSELAEEAFKRINPDKIRTRTSGAGYDLNAQEGYIEHDNWTQDYEEYEVTFDEICHVMQHIYDTDADMAHRIDQQFDMYDDEHNRLYEQMQALEQNGLTNTQEYRKAQARYNNLHQTLYSNGKPKTPGEWVSYQIANNGTAEELAYKIVTDINENGISLSQKPSSGGGGNIKIEIPGVSPGEQGQTEKKKENPKKKKEDARKKDNKNKPKDASGRVGPGESTKNGKVKARGTRPGVKK